MKTVRGRQESLRWRWQINGSPDWSFHRDHLFCFADLFSEKMISGLVLSCNGMVMVMAMVMVETQRLENLLAAFWAFEKR